MAFGTSWKCNQFAIDQIKASSGPATGELDEAVYQVNRPDIAASFWYLVDVRYACFGLCSIAYPYYQCMGGQNRPFPLIRLSHFFTSFHPTYRAHRSTFDQELQRAIRNSRQRFQAAGADLEAFNAQNTLDLMIGKTELNNDNIPDDEIRDEIMTCMIDSSILSV